MLQFVVSILIAGVILANAEGFGGFLKALATKRLTGKRGEELREARLPRRCAASPRASSAWRSSNPCWQAVGLLAVDVPGAGLWALLLILLLAIVQLPPLLVLAPIILYVFSTASTTVAVIFMVWSILVSMSDAFLKPLLLGRGVEVPMLIILIGAIGGMIHSGIIGLFVGAVVLALGYELFKAWLTGRAASEGTIACNGSR